MAKSSHLSRRKSSLAALLTSLVHPDVIPLVLSYEATIQFEWQRSYGQGCGGKVGEMDHPTGLALTLAVIKDGGRGGSKEDELVVVDSNNQRIQVFHQGTGRFLRQWGRYGWADGDFRFPESVVIGLSTEHGHQKEELFVRDVARLDVQIFQLSNGLFLRRFALPSSCITVWRDQLFVDNKNGIEVRSSSDGKWIRTIERSEATYKLFMDEDVHGPELFIVEKNGIEVFNLTSGHVVRQYGGGPGHVREKHKGGKLQNPRAVIVHGEEVIVCDADYVNGHRLVVFDHSTGEMVRAVASIDDDRLDTRSFCYPWDVAVNSHHQLFVCDSLNHRVLVFE